MNSGTKLTTAQSALVWCLAAGAYYVTSTRIYPHFFPQATGAKAVPYTPRDLEEHNIQKKKELEKKGYPPTEKSPHTP